MTNQRPKMAGRFPCPKCKQPGTKVRITGESDDGIITRKRWCPHCGHNFFTAQEPEWVVPRDEITWSAFNKPLWQEKADPATPARSAA